MSNKFGGELLVGAGLFIILVGLTIADQLAYPNSAVQYLYAGFIWVIIAVLAVLFLQIFFNAVGYIDLLRPRQKR